MRMGGVVSESEEPRPDDTLESSSSSRRRAAERVYGASFALRLETECELLLDVCRGTTTGGGSPPGNPPGISVSERRDGVPP